MSENGPVRTCIGCGGKFPKEDVLRFVVDNDRRLLPDINRKLPGRGASACLESSCIKRAVQKKAFSKYLKNFGEEDTFEIIAEKIITMYSNYLYTIMRLGFGGQKIVTGLDNCSKRIKNRELFLCLLVNDISENSLQRIKPVADKFQVKVLFLDDKRIVAEKMHRPIRAVYGIVDRVFARKIEDIINKIDKVKTWIG